MHERAATFVRIIFHIGDDRAGIVLMELSKSFDHDNMDDDGEREDPSQRDISHFSRFHEGFLRIEGRSFPSLGSFIMSWNS